jgi:RNA polymerase sigma factor (TIGR02999 family)
MVGPIETDLADSVTRLLDDARGGDEGAWDRIYALIYKDLHRIARSQVRRQAVPSFSPTSLINETWLRLASANVSTDNRSHLTSLIAKAMRYVLLDQARRVLSGKRGDGLEQVALDQAEHVSDDIDLQQLLEMDQALKALEQLDSRMAKVVELRYFGGMSEAEVSEHMGITIRTVSRDWRKAKAYLRLHLDEHETP